MHNAAAFSVKERPGTADLLEERAVIESQNRKPALTGAILYRLFPPSVAATRAKWKARAAAEERSPVPSADHTVGGGVQLVVQEPVARSGRERERPVALELQFQPTRTSGPILKDRAEAQRWSS